MSNIAYRQVQPVNTDFHFVSGMLRHLPVIERYVHNDTETRLVCILRQQLLVYRKLARTVESELRDQQHWFAGQESMNRLVSEWLCSSRMLEVEDRLRRREDASYLKMAGF
jgi:hypothetical protein